MKIIIFSISKLHCLWFVLLLFYVSNLHAAKYFVSPTGSNENPGTKQQPFATLQKAASVLKPGDTCILRKGIYREILRPNYSGTAEAKITFKNYRNEKVILSACDAIDGWKYEHDGIYSAAMVWNLKEGNQIFADNKMQNEACWPNAGENPLFQPERAKASGGNKTTLTCKEIPGPNNAWEDAELWCAGGKAWICWTSKVTSYDAQTNQLTFNPAREDWYTPQKGNPFVLRGVRYALNKPGEWYYDSTKKRILLIPPDHKDPQQIKIEAKRRMDVIDLTNRSHIRIQGIEFRGGGIRTNENSTHIVLKDLKGRYVSHAYTRDVSHNYGVLVLGNDILILNCDFGYSSASVVTVGGHDNRIINCNIHHGGYAGLWKGTVSLSGRRIVFSHNTVRHAGRDLINTHGLMESLVQYNDVSEAGWLTKDLGMFYGHNTDYANTVFKYNHVHDNRAEHLPMGIYFDHLSNNAIVHHNVVWNVEYDPIRFNNPAYCNLVYNNTCWKSGGISTFDHADRNDLFATRFFNNIFNKPVNLPQHVTLKNNYISEDPPFKSPANKDFRLDTGLGNIGAYSPGEKLRRTGCNMEHPPDPLPEYKPPHVPWMNMIKNACFEFDSLEAWRKTGNSKIKLVEGNGWGLNRSSGNPLPTGTSKHELRLGPRRSGVNQIIKDLYPGTKYKFSAWLKVSDTSERVIMGVKENGAKEVSTGTSSAEWVRRSISFTTGPTNTKATIYLIKKSESSGYAWVDNLTLPLCPRESDKKTSISSHLSTDFQ